MPDGHHRGGGFGRRAALREIGPVPLGQIRDHLPTARLRFGFVELEPDDAAALWALLTNT